MRVVRPQTVCCTDSEDAAAHAFAFEQVLAQTGEAVIVKNRDAVVTYWNREAAALYGFSSQEAVGRTLRELHAADLSDAEYARIMERIRSGKPSSSSPPTDGEETARPSASR